MTDYGLSSYMQIRQLKTDEPSLLLYKCLARNEFGSSERLIKLIALGIPLPPSELRVRDIWSRSALISWQPPPTTSGSTGQQQSKQSAGETSGSVATGRISNYTVQYWRKNPTVQTLTTNHHQLKQNHRRDDLVVDGLHNTALLVNLLPAITYEVSVIAHNQVGRSEPSEPINVTTSEEEPSAPPTDVQLEPRGSSTLRVMWKIPPIESLNGKLLGFYVGYRPRFITPATSLLQSTISSQVASVGGVQSQQQQMLQSVIYSFKTADAFEGQIFYETFLANLKHNQEYEITVRAFNKAGSGPDCHVITARTSSAKLPQAPNLQVQKVTSNSMTLKWTATVFISNPTATLVANQRTSISGSGPAQQQSSLNGNMATEILRYVLYYQIQGERDWYELTVGRSTTTDTEQQTTDSLQASLGLPATNDELMMTGELITSHASVHTLSNLQPGYTYRVYVAAANDYGIGDPSNVVTLRTDLPNNHNLTNSLTAFLGTAVLDDTGSLVSGSTSGGGFFEQLGRQQQQWGLLYTTLTFSALVGLLVILAVYLVWQHKIRNKYNHSSSASSYPSSWTPATSDTIQSEYSIKRFPGPTSGGHQAAALNGTQDPFTNHQSGDQSTSSRFAPVASNRQQLRSSGTVTRPIPQLSSHYHQPADLISNSSTLQLHSSLAPGGFSRQKASATLNRNQNRQLPPIPYSTMSVKEMDGSNKQWRLQVQQQQHQEAGGYRQQSLLHPSKQHPQHNQQMATSQTPLIYGVIE